MEIETKQNLTTVQQRLRYFISTLGITDREFCKRVGLSPSYVSSMRKSVSPSVMTKISELYPRLNPQWLLAGFGEMLFEKTQEADKQKTNLLPSQILERLLEESSVEKARLMNVNEKLTSIIESQQETLAELTREIKKINARKDDNAVCADVG